MGAASGAMINPMQRELNPSPNQPVLSAPRGIGVGRVSVPPKLGSNRNEKKEEGMYDTKISTKKKRRLPPGKPPQGGMDSKPGGGIKGGGVKSGGKPPQGGPRNPLKEMLGESRKPRVKEY